LHASSQEETKEFLPMFFANQKREANYGFNALLQASVRV
jgi:hypothetical protein